MYPAGASGIANFDGGAHGFLLAGVFARLALSRVVLLSAMFYSFTYLAYSSSGTFSLLAIAICEADNLTVLRPFGVDDLEAVVPAEATLGLLDFLGVS